MEEHSYLCLPEHARSFTQTKLVPEIYTTDEISEMFYGVLGSQEKNDLAKGFIAKGFLGFLVDWREDPKRFIIGTPLISIYLSMQLFIPYCCYELLSHVWVVLLLDLGFK